MKFKKWSWALAALVVSSAVVAAQFSITPVAAAATGGGETPGSNTAILVIHNTSAHGIRGQVRESNFVDPFGIRPHDSRQYSLPPGQVTVVFDTNPPDGARVTLSAGQATIVDYPVVR